MEEIRYQHGPVLIVGNGRLASSIAVCLLQAGHPVTILTDNETEVMDLVERHAKDLHELALYPDVRKLTFIKELNAPLAFRITIALADEDLKKKRLMIRQLESRLPETSIIAVNTESFAMSALQENSKFPGRILGVNWVEPAHTTFFLELIVNSAGDNELAFDLYTLAKTCWNKDPYLIYNEVGVRSRMFSAMVREALYLVKNGYASIEDIDRACRNDPGYYLPFVGNCRYIDLMGAYAYGVVMKSLNRELSKDTEIPDFVENIIDEGGLGMENGKGFYDYKAGEVEKWEGIFRKFSIEIHQIIKKYPST